MKLNDREARTLIECITKQIKELNKEYFDSSFYESKIKELRDLRSKIMNK